MVEAGYGVELKQAAGEGGRGLGGVLAGFGEVKGVRRRVRRCVHHHIVVDPRALLAEAPNLRHRHTSSRAEPLERWGREGG